MLPCQSLEAHTQIQSNIFMIYNVAQKIQAMSIRAAMKSTVESFDELIGLHLAGHGGAPMVEFQQSGAK